MRARSLLAALGPPALAAAVLLSATSRAAGAEILRPGESVDGMLEANRDRAFVAHLEVGQRAQVEVTQIGLDVELEVTGPNGEVLAKVDQARVREASEAFTWVVGTSGLHRITLRTRRAHPEGRFRLCLEPVRTAGPADRQLIEANRSFADGVREREGQGEESRHRAVAAFEKAADLWSQAGAPRGQMRALIAAGVLECALDPAQAAAKCTAALGLAQSTADIAHEAGALSCLAESFYAAGAYDEAIESQQSALEAAVAGGNRFRESEALQNLAVFHAARLESEPARTRYEEALALARAIGDEEVRGFALVGLGLGLTSTGEYQRAQDLLEEGLEVHRAMGDRPAQCNGLINIALNRQLMGDYDEALAVAEEASRLAHLTGTPLNEVYALSLMSNIATARGDWKAGVLRARQALEVAQRVNAPREEIRALESLARAHFKAREFSASGRAIAASVAVSRRMGAAPTTPTLLNLCHLREAEGNLSEAADRCAEALETIRLVGPQRLEAFASYLIARLERRQGNLEGARRRAEDALGLLEKWRSRLRRTDWRESFIGSQREIDDFYVDLMIEVAAREGQDRTAEAFDAAERTRTRALRDALSESRLAGHEAVDGRLVARERQLRHQLARGIEAQLRRGPDATAAEAASAARLPQLEEELKSVESEIRRLSPRYAGLNESTPLGVGQLQESVLDADTALLAFALGESRSAMWVVTSDTLEMHLLPGRARLDDLVRAAHGSLSGPRRRASGAGQELARLIVGPALQRLRPRLLVIADGALHYLPFAALPDPRGGVLLDRHEIAVLPSVSTIRLLREPREPARQPARAVAVLADPVFRADDERIARAGGRAAPATRVPGNVARAALDFGGLEELTRLPFTRREAMRIAALTGGAGESFVALDFDATLRTVREGKLGEYRFVHFATHGFLNTRRPELSGLVLSLFDAQGRPQEGFLSALDAFNLDLSAEVVILSGCRTALGKEVRGEGMVGLPRAFMYAGARRVVSSLWAVDDRATAALMGRFYEGLLAPKPLRPAEALRAAQSYVRSQTQWRHPYYWAAFQLQGDWN